MSLKNKPLIEGPSGFLLLGSFIALAIAFSPYIFYIYEIFPSGKVWENSYFTYESLYYENVTTAAWTYLGKVMPLFLLLIWFFTCKHWWYHAILIPIGMYIFQIIVAFYQDAYMDSSIFMDTDGLLYLAPYFIGILCFLYLVRIQIFDRIYGIDLSELNETNISVFSPFSKKDMEEIEAFQKDSEGKSLDHIGEEDYYKEL